MKVILIALATCVSLALVPDAAFAQAKKKVAAAAGKCSAGQSCSRDCNTIGWCSRFVCSGGKWEKRMVGCVGGLCGPKCS
jgi:hypothetical protein